MPIALTDAALAHICIAATAVKPGARRRWLLDLAQQIDPDLTPAGRKRARGREKWRRWYEESRAGVATALVKYDAVGVAQLIRAGWLRRHPDDIYTQQQISDAISDLIRTNLPNRLG
jgi:hypothetical protein